MFRAPPEQAFDSSRILWEYTSGASGTRNQITAWSEAAFFRKPRQPLHRQYEALRAFFVDRQASSAVARRFRYSPGAFRVLCYQFRHDPARRRAFFQAPQRGPRHAPARDRVRPLAVAMRKRNLSIYDIQRELAAAGHPISINALAVLMREEGFSRLPRRRDDERPPTLKPDTAAVADVRRVNLAPRSFRTRLGGLFLFVPLLQPFDLPRVVRHAALPRSRMIPAEQAVRSLLALKLLGKERKSHVMDLVFDDAVAVFAGLNVVPKRSFLAAYSSSIDHRANLRVMDAWFRQVAQAGLPNGTSFDLDFHTVPANTTEEPLEKHYVSARSRSQTGILTFLARDAEQRVLRYASAGIPKAERAAEILRFVTFWKRHTGTQPAEVVFDSQLTTYDILSTLNEQGIAFITLRRRSRKMLGELLSRPAAAWRRITLPALTRTFRTPRVLEDLVTLPGYHGRLRQLAVLDLGHEEPTILLTNKRTGTDRGRRRGNYPLCPPDAHRERHLGRHSILPHRCAVFDGGAEDRFRSATDADGQLALSAHGHSDRARLRPRPAQDPLSQSPGSVRHRDGRRHAGHRHPRQAGPQPVSGRVRADGAAHADALVWQQAPADSVCLSTPNVSQFRYRGNRG